MKRLIFAAAIMLAGPAMAQERATVFFTKDISAESLVSIYKALGVEATGRVALKISTGESERSNHLRPAFIKPLVDETKATIVECNTAYGGNRSTTESHRRAISERGYDKIATVDIMDEEGTMNIPTQDQKHIAYDIVGSHLANYDFMINLAHFKGHAMGGFGGVLKNASIGVASRSGKSYIHTAGRSTTSPWGGQQDPFLESMAAAAQAVHNYFGGKVLYINVMNNLSVDCDCDGNPSKPQMADVGILASTDPIALDKACLDLVFNHDNTTGNTAVPLQTRINNQHGQWTVEYGEKIGLGTQAYNLIDLDNQTAVDSTISDKGTPIYNVYTIDGKRVMAMASSLDPLAKGVYIVNGQKTVVK
ncbi:MAG: DUF362 domain-containing protein [Prevotella sp.]|nr:DUF362 domain-containing protein [Prevotella sp.]